MISNILVSAKTDDSDSEDTTHEVRINTNSAGAYVDRVEFYANDRKVGTSNWEPYQIDWLKDSVGSYDITAKAYLINGDVRNSGDINFWISDTDNIPSVPANFDANLNQDNYVDLTWTDSDVEDGFLIEKDVNDGGYQYLDSLLVNATSYTDSSVTSGNSYRYRIIAYNTYPEFQDTAMKTHYISEIRLL